MLFLHTKENCFMQRFHTAHFHCLHLLGRHSAGLPARHSPWESLHEIRYPQTSVVWQRNSSFTAAWHMWKLAHSHRIIFHGSDVLRWVMPFAHSSLACPIASIPRNAMPRARAIDLNDLGSLTIGPECSHALCNSIQPSPFCFDLPLLCEAPLLIQGKLFTAWIAKFWRQSFLETFDRRSPKFSQVPSTPFWALANSISRDPKISLLGSVHSVWVISVCKFATS